MHNKDLPFFNPPQAPAGPPILARYREPSRRRSIIELVITAGALALLWVLMWKALDVGYWLSLLLAIPTAGFLMRLFMIQHDCVHGAFFRYRLANDWLGGGRGGGAFKPRYFLGGPPPP